MFERIRNRVRQSVHHAQVECARWWLLRKLDRIGMPRSESTRIVGFVLDSKFPHPTEDVCESTEKES